MFKNFLMKKMLARQMKGLPEAEQEKMIAAINKNPELFKKVADEVQEKVKQGKGQMAATMEVFRKYHNELRDALGK